MFLGGNPMKLKFKHQSFQSDAVAAIVDLFKGQERRQDTFTITNERQISLDAGLGVGNAISISDEQIVTNMNAVQKKHSLPLTNDLTGSTAEGVLGGASRSFCIEMETGTGKTYVYTKTIYELHKQYGFTKFIVVVPSVAIREGVYKSFQITADHFAAQYDNTPVHCFIYDSKKLSSVRLFATSSDIEIMIINIDAFKKSENIINQAQDRLNGESAMNYIKDTHPIVIIDEPQSVDNTPKAKEAIASLNPLCVFRYSATHREKINLLYRLTPVDAYQMGLVKQICVSSNQVDNDFNRPYIRLVSVSHDNGFSAKIELDKIMKSGKAERKIITVKPGADLYELSGERDLYEGYSIAGIDCMPGNESVEFANGEMLYLGKAIGDIDDSLIKRAQIRRTIEAHLEKELRYTEKGIKVLSLFFIDEVSRYRGVSDQLPDASVQKGDASNQMPDASYQKGEYAVMFEECYAELINLPKFSILRYRFHGSEAPLDTGHWNLESIHNGYFSQDKKGNYKDTKGDTIDDYDTYNTIMKDKEWLLSFDCPLRFIFSHSALKEGWDNPNVFQVCTLIEQKSTFTCRQKVGRGLRLCVNQDGERIEDKNINILHVMANESFAEFADTLQKEIESETGVKFGVLQLSLFSGVTFDETVIEEKKPTEEQAELIVELVSRLQLPDTRNNEMQSGNWSLDTRNSLPLELKPVLETVTKAVALGASVAEITPAKVAEITYTETKTVEKTVSYDDASELLNHFQAKGYVTKTGTIKDTMKEALKNGTLDLPKKFEAAREKFETIISKADKKVEIKNANNQVKVHLKKEVMLSPEFLALWDKIKGRTSYRVHLDEEALKRSCIEEIGKYEPVIAAQIVTRTGTVDITNPGVTVREGGIRTQKITDESYRLPDFFRMVNNECFLSHRTVFHILRESGRIPDFLNNPQRMIEIFIEAVKTVMSSMEIDGISYHRLDGEEYYLQEVFDSEELTGFLEKNAIPVEHSVYDYVLYDSDTVERPFAVALDDDPDVKMFFKIPDKFKIETPIGTYNPDWAVYLDKDGEEKLYFVLETKGVSGLLGLHNLKTPEQQKIHCGEEHFTALGSGVEFSGKPVKDWREFKVTKA
jgi:type III restriction enzyme